MDTTVLHAAIAELERRRQQLDQAIVTLRALDGRAGEPVPAAALEDIQQLYESGVGIKEIAKRARVKPQTIYSRAYAGKWKRPKMLKGKVEQSALPGKVRCPHCQEWTETDPCGNCKKAVRGGAW